MPQPDIDPILAAAMIEDDDETDEEKKQREELTAEVAAGSAPSKDEDDDEDDDLPEVDEDEEDEDDKSDPKKDKKPSEAEDDTDDDVDDDLEEDEDEDKDPPKKSRKQRRQERQEDFLTSVRRDTKPRQRQEIPDYKPIDYGSSPKDEDGNEREYTADELDDDRKRVAATEFAKGADTARYWAEQDGFWRDLQTESKIISYNPELSFLSETTPDGKKNENFDEDKAGEINENYLQFVGFKRHPKRDENGRVLVDNNGKPIISHVTVDRTDISYEKYAKRYVDNMKRWTESEVDTAVQDTKQKSAKARNTRSIRPTGGKRKSIGSLNPGDISRMSDEDFEKNEAEIDRQIDAMLGL